MWHVFEMFAPKEVEMNSPELYGSDSGKSAKNKIAFKKYGLITTPPW